jgi:hypothetical protein
MSAHMDACSSQIVPWGLVVVVDTLDNYIHVCEGDPLEMMFVKVKEHLRHATWSKIAIKYDAWTSAKDALVGRSIAGTCCC